MGCDASEHPDPKTVRWLFCRDCGYWVEGVRLSDATDAVFRECLETVPTGMPVDLRSCSK